ncbi:MAG: zinc transporter ZupT [Candidatus Heimdallarchaeota archaeon]
MPNQFLFALLLSSIAGCSTTIGAILACLVKRPSARMLSLGLGFSAGVMLSISFLEMLPEALELADLLATYTAFFSGMFIMAGLDLFVPHVENELARSDFDPELIRTGKLTALGVSIHNFPEGIITFLGTIVDLKIGLLLMLAIALHNIPEGMSVSFPIFYATKDRKKAFMLSFLSGLAEPLGALVAGVILFQFLNDTVLGIGLSLVAGIMIFLSLHELIPVAHKYDDSRRIASIGVIAGIIIMMITLPLFA